MTDDEIAILTANGFYEAAGVRQWKKDNIIVCKAGSFIMSFKIGDYPDCFFASVEFDYLTNMALYNYTRQLKKKSVIFLSSILDAVKEI